MTRKPLIEEIEKQELAHAKERNFPDFHIGDTVKVYNKIIEGEKERVQAISGVVIAKNGKGLSQTFTLYRTAYGTSMERVFMLSSPRVSKIEITRKGKVRRSKLYYLRGAKGKASKVKELLGFEQKKEEAVETETESEKE